MWKSCLALVVGVVLGTSLTYFYQVLRVERERTLEERLDDVDAVGLRILCLIPTFPAHNKDLQAIKDTWGRRCDVLLFMSTQENQDIPTIALPVREGYTFLWGKMKASFRYVYERHLQDVDWVLKTDDDTYVVMENLKRLLIEYNSSDALYFGHRFERDGSGWMSGGAGYVLSREAVRRLVEEGECEESDEGPEDVAVSMCLESVGVTPVDTRDSLGRERFLPLNLIDHLIPEYGPQFWYLRYTKYPQGKGFHCCSDLVVAIHYTQPRYMYLYEFLIYHLNPARPTAYPGCNASARPTSYPSSGASDGRPTDNSGFGASARPTAYPGSGVSDGRPTAYPGSGASAIPTSYPGSGASDGRPTDNSGFGASARPTAYPGSGAADGRPTDNPGSGASARPTAYPGSGAADGRPTDNPGSGDSASPTFFLNSDGSARQTSYSGSSTSARPTDNPGSGASARPTAY